MARKLDIKNVCLKNRDKGWGGWAGFLDDAQVVGQTVKVVKTLKKLDISFNKIGTKKGNQNFANDFFN